MEEILARFREHFGESPEWGLAANYLSTLPQNSVSLTFLTLKFDRENFPKIDELRDDSTMPAVPSRDKLGRQSVEAVLLRTLQDD
jgi:hypothetical protein